MNRVFIAGHLTRDIYPDGVRLGGSVLYGAAAYASLGATVTVHTAHAESRSPFVHACNLRMREDNAGAVTTTTFENVYDPAQRVEQTLHGQAPTLRPPDVMRPYRIVHLAPVIGEVPLTARGAWRSWLAVQRAHYRPPLVVLGLQGWLRGGRQDQRVAIRRLDLALHPDALPRVDLVFCSDEDLDGQPAHLLRELRRRSALVVRTHGADGCTVYERSCERRFAAQSSRCDDPTGAGDTFAAAFSHALASGERIPRCARIAARCVRTVGAPSFNMASLGEAVPTPIQRSVGAAE